MSTSYASACSAAACTAASLALLAEADQPLLATNLYIKGLPLDWTEVDLKRVFSPYGNVLSSRVMYDQATFTSRGAGFVRFKQHDVAQQAMSAMHGFVPPNANKPLHVTFSKEQGSVDGSRHGPNPYHYETCFVQATVNHNGQSYAFCEQLPIAPVGTDPLNLYVCDLPLSLTTPEFDALYRPFGSMQTATIISDTSTGLSRCIGFVRFLEPLCAARALTQTQGQWLTKDSIKPILVRFAKDTSRRSKAAVTAAASASLPPGTTTQTGASAADAAAHGAYRQLAEEGSALAMGPLNDYRPPVPVPAPIPAVIQSAQQHQQLQYHQQNPLLQSASEQQQQQQQQQYAVLYDANGQPVHVPQSSILPVQTQQMRSIPPNWPDALQQQQQQAWNQSQAAAYYQQQPQQYAYPPPGYGDPNQMQNGAYAASMQGSYPPPAGAYNPHQQPQSTAVPNALPEGVPANGAAQPYSQLHPYAQPPLYNSPADAAHRINEVSRSRPSRFGEPVADLSQTLSAARATANAAALAASRAAAAESRLYSLTHPDPNQQSDPAKVLMGVPLIVASKDQRDAERKQEIAQHEARRQEIERDKLRELEDRIARHKHQRAVADALEAEARAKIEAARRAKEAEIRKIDAQRIAQGLPLIEVGRTSRNRDRPKILVERDPKVTEDRILELAEQRKVLRDLKRDQEREERERARQAEREKLGYSSEDNRRPSNGRKSPIRLSGRIPNNVHPDRQQSVNGLGDARPGESRRGSHGERDRSVDSPRLNSAHSSRSSSTVRRNRPPVVILRAQIEAQLAQQAEEEMRQQAQGEEPRNQSPHESPHQDQPHSHSQRHSVEPFSIHPYPGRGEHRPPKSPIRLMRSLPRARSPRSPIQVSDRPAYRAAHFAPYIHRQKSPIRLSRDEQAPARPIPPSAWVRDPRDEREQSHMRHRSSSQPGAQEFYDEPQFNEPSRKRKRR